MMKNIFLFLTLVTFACVQLSNQSKSKGADFERLPGLGRIVSLGSVYYAADQRLAFDEALWKIDTIQTKSTKQQITYSTSNVKLINNFHDKFSLFNINAEVTVGLLGGLIQITGSAGYLRHDKTLREKSKLYMTYKSITETEYISQDMRKSIDFDEVCDLMYDKENPATHVVSSITRGFQGNGSRYLILVFFRNFLK